VSRLSPRTRDLGAGLLLCGTIVALFWDSIFGGRVLFERDINQVYWGQAEIFVRCIFAGSWPVWDPLAGFGQPLLANPSAQVLYPWTWLNLLIEPTRFYTLFACSHLVLGGLGLYLYGRSLRVSRVSAVTAAALWMVGGPLLSMVSLWHHFATAAWIPWVLLAVDRTVEQPTLARGARLSFLLALQILAGSADMIVLTGLILLGSTARHWSTLDLRSAWPRLRALVLAGGLAMGLTAVQVLPALELARTSDRASLPKPMRELWSVPPAGLLQVVLPVFPYLFPISKSVRADLYDSREPFLNSLYLGLASLPLVLSAFLGRWRRLALGFAAVALFATVAAVGRFSFVHGLLTTVLPPLQSLRYPVKAMIVPALAWALLAGLGLETWRESWAAERSARTGLRLSVLAALLVALLSAVILLRPDLVDRGFLDPTSQAAAGAVGSVARGLAVAAALCATVTALGARTARSGLGAGPCFLVLALVVADVFVAHRPLNPTARPETFAPPPVIDRLRADQATRVYAFDYLAKVLGKTLLRPDPTISWPPRVATEPASWKTAMIGQSLLRSPVAERFGLAGSYDFDMLGLQPRALRNLGLYLRTTEETPAFARLLRIGAVSHVVSMHRVGLDDLRPLATLPTAFTEPVHLFAVPGALPRAYAVSGARVLDGLPALAMLTDPGFDPAREVVLSSGSPAAISTGFTASLHVRTWAPDRIALDSELSEPGFVVLVEGHDPGWRAALDGAEVAVLRANVGFRALAVPAGPHRIEFFYRPKALALGAGISACTLALALGLALRRGPGAHPLRA